MDEDHHLSACIHLVASTGLRRGEALGLRCEDVNLTEEYVLIRASLSLSRERGLILEPPKTESGRRTWTGRRWMCCTGTGNGRMKSSGP